MSASLAYVKSLAVNLEVCRYLNIVSMMKLALLDLCALSASQVVKHGEFRKKKTPLERPLRCFVTEAKINAAKEKKAKIAKVCLGACSATEVNRT